MGQAPHGQAKIARRACLCPGSPHSGRDDGDLPYPAPLSHGGFLPASDFLGPIPSGLLRAHRRRSQAKLARWKAVVRSAPDCSVKTPVCVGVWASAPGVIVDTTTADRDRSRLRNVLLA